MSTCVTAKFKFTLKGYDPAKATVHFTSEKPLPASLLKRLLKARRKGNEARKKR